MRSLHLINLALAFCVVCVGPAGALGCSAGSCSASCSGGCGCVSDHNHPDDCSCFCEAVMLKANEPKFDLSATGPAGDIVKAKASPNDLGNLLDSRSASCLRRLKRTLVVNVSSQPKEAVRLLLARFCRLAQ